MSVLMHCSPVYNALRRFLYLVRDRMLLMERGVHLARFLFTIASFFFHSCDVTRLMCHTAGLHGRISPSHWSSGQVRLRILLRAYSYLLPSTFLALSRTTYLINRFSSFYIRFMSVLYPPRSACRPCYFFSLKTLFSDSFLLGAPTGLNCSE